MAQHLSPVERQRRSDLMIALEEKKRAAREAPLVVTEPLVPLLRVSMPDLDAWGPWLLKRLKHRFPHLSDRMFHGWLRGCMESNEFLFVRSTNAIGLAQVVRSPLQPMADVMEVFVLLKEEQIAEGVAIYDEFRRWTLNMGARDLIVDNFTDVPKEVIQANLGRLYNRVLPFIRLNQMTQQ